MGFLLGVLLPYSAFIVFFSGTVLRIGGWLKTPVPFQLTLFPVPGYTTGKIRALALDFIFCASLYREDKALWLRVWFFHLSLALIIAGHVAGIFYLRDQFVLVGLSEATSRFLSKLLGGISGIVMMLSLGALIAGRIVNPVVRKLSVPEDFFNLLLIAAIAVSGILMYLPGFHADLPAVRTYMGELIRLRPAALPHSPMFVIHFVLVNMLLLYFPFSRLLHFAGYFVNRSMLLENPPTYPTKEGASPRSTFASVSVHADLQDPGKDLMGKEGHP
ncbi:MAG: respiratory nitrate reductase subunit gamma [Geobacteraceae bacterium]|nr:respiratory nitrate reductase subunit gamma [Geobacteraceae bacterium]